MDALLEALTRREIVVGLAILGAILATVGSLARSRLKGPAKVVVYAGYAITGVSILLFIGAGFRA